MHARLGVYAKWFCRDCTANQYSGRLACRDCTANQYSGRLACRDCCGYTTNAAKVVRGVLTMKGKPLRGCLR